MKLIVSIYDRTANWPRPYIEAGYPVLCWDKAVEGCILERFNRLRARIERALRAGCKFHGLLCAPPCTDFAGSGARWWKTKDATPPVDGDTWNQLDYAVALVEIIFHIIELYHPHFWVIENPVGRLEQLVPDIAPFRRITFDPCDYGDPYTKKTILYGRFNARLPKRPCRSVNRHYIHHMPPSPDRAAKRSATPKGFARAFFAANP